MSGYGHQHGLFTCQLVSFDYTVKAWCLPESLTSMIARLFDAPFESRAARTSRPMRGRVAIVMDDIPFLAGSQGLDI